MKYSLLSFVILFSALVLAQPVNHFNPYKKDLKSFKLKGKVARVDYVQNENGQQMRTGSYIFNEMGLLLFEIYDNDTINTYSYDDEGNLLFSHYKFRDTEFYYSYEADSKNNLSKFCIGETCGDYEWKDRDLISGTFDELYSFNKAGDLILKKETGSTYKYTYNSKKLVSKILTTTPYDDFSEELIYNKQNDVVKSIFKDAYEGTTETKYEYTYDKKNNWIKCLKSFTFNKDEEIRTITYFEASAAAAKKK